MSSLLPCLASTGKEFLEASFILVQSTTNELPNGFNTSFEEVNIESQLFVSKLRFISLVGVFNIPMDPMHL